MKIKLTEIRNVEPRRAHGNIKELAESIRREGLLQPLVVNQDNKLICGRRRLEAVSLLGWDEVEVYRVETKDDIDSLLKAIAENVMRLNLTWQEEVRANEELEQLREAKYGKSTWGGNRKSSSSNELERPSLEKTAKETKQSIGKLSQDIQLAKALKEYPELEKIKTKTGALIELKKKRQKEEIKTLKPPEGLYQVIVIDPPWETMYNPTGRRGGAKYPTMTEIEIKDIKLPADKDCVLWLWTTNKFLHEAFHILEYWGFQYKNIFTWVKSQLGLGDWGRTQTEHILLGVKGKPLVDFKNQKNIIIADRKGHSEKPDKFYKMVEKCCFGKARLDYFARKQRKGWSSYGDEVK